MLNYRVWPGDLEGWTGRGACVHATHLFLCGARSSGRHRWAPPLACLQKVSSLARADSGKKVQMLRCRESRGMVCGRKARGKFKWASLDPRAGGQQRPREGVHSPGWRCCVAEWWVSCALGTLLFFIAGGRIRWRIAFWGVLGSGGSTVGERNRRIEGGCWEDSVGGSGVSRIAQVDVLARVTQALGIWTLEEHFIVFYYSLPSPWFQAFLLFCAKEK